MPRPPGSPLIAAAGIDHRQADHDRQHAEPDDHRTPRPQRLVEHRARRAERIGDLAETGPGDHDAEHDDHDGCESDRDATASRGAGQAVAAAAEADVLERERANHDRRHDDQLVTDERNDERRATIAAPMFQRLGATSTRAVT